ncbi:4-oxalocrotonate tautomerase family protein [Mariniflexile sp. HMF6888]|uniref:4-oxalocrotonate tautomerase family protein n=1 Tax=Mariniflexile sp. HMF6888 TaxID=3373086 RepID=UPI00378EC5FB
MPLLRITYHRGSITDSQKNQLAEKLTPILIEGEVGQDNEQARALAYVIFQETDPRSEWFVGGKPDINAPKGGRFLLEVWYVEGAATQSEKTIVHRKMNEVLSNVIGVDGTFPNRLTDWVIINEVKEGAWGASGVTVGVKEANEALGGSEGRAEYFQRFLSAKQSLFKEHGFPSERGKGLS